MMTYVQELRKRWMKNPGFRAEYDAQKPTFELMMAMVEARVNAGLTQQEVAQCIGTSQSAIARLEGWSTNPSINTLLKYAEATGTRLKISFEPIEVEADEPEAAAIQPEQSKIQQPETELAAALD